MATGHPEKPSAVVISDDTELGGLLALNLRRRHFLVEQTDPQLVGSPLWSPATDRLAVAVIVVERPTTDARALLSLVRRKTGPGVPVVLAADDAAGVIAKVGDSERMVPAEVDNVGGIITAALALVRKAVPV